MSNSKGRWEKIIDNAFSLAFAIIFLFIVVASIQQCSKNDDDKKICEEKCGIYKFQSINGFCHCKSEKGWELQKDSANE